MVGGPLRCLCCSKEMSTTDLIGFRCDCTKDEWGMATMCLDCGKCDKHCQCPEGTARDWNEVARRSVAGTLSHQREARHADRRKRMNNADDQSLSTLGHADVSQREAL